MEIIKSKDCTKFVARDNAIVREIVSHRNSSVKHQSLAEVTIPPDTSINEHYHIKTEELYYIIAGIGKMFIEGEEQIVSIGDAVIILPGQRHKINNQGETDLMILVMCAPGYEDEDQIICHK
jgi:mannose-6-phosphate isomerase-like protein (cupin superfamily)